MDAIDNPSYFNLSTDDHAKFRNFLSARRWSDGTKSSSLTLPNNTFAVRRGTSTTQSRRTFRSLKKANSEDTHLLVLGKPRPSDLPPTVYATRHGQHNSAGNVNSNDLLHQDMVHCGGMTNEDDNNDVFLSNNKTVQYYNAATLPINRVLVGRRRHSIGSFLHRDRSFTPAVEHDTRNSEASTRRKFKRISIDNVGGKMTEDELDILLVSCGESELATVWVDYLISCFQRFSIERKKSPFKLQNVKIETMLCVQPNTNVAAKCPNAKLQIVIVCPLFLEKVQITPLQENPLGRILSPEKVLAMMLGVQDQNENDHLKIVFSDYDQWRKMNIKDQDTTSVGDFLGVAMDILCRTWQMQEMLNSKQQEQMHFSIFPKKVKTTQDKLIVLFTEPLTADDTVNIFIDKSGQRIEVTSVKRRNPYTIQFTMPSNFLHFCMLVNIQVEKNGKPMGKRKVKCESRMGELEQLLRSLNNPISFLSQSFGLNITDREQMDMFLLGVFLKNVPSHFHLLNPGIGINKNNSCSEEFPTLLHFAAKHGFEKLACQLIESPGGEQASQIRNSFNLTPAEIAEKANFEKLANALKGHMQMTELATMYNYMKTVTNESIGQLNDCNYILPRPANDTYLIPPAARPIDQQAVVTRISGSSETQEILHQYENFKPGNVSMLKSVSPTFSTTSNSTVHAVFENYEIPRNGKPYVPHTPSTPCSPIEKKFEGYLEMNPAGSESSNFGSVSSFQAGNSDFSEYVCNSDKSTEFCKTDRESVFSETFSSSSKYDSANHLSNKEKLSPDDELLEIINDFKNNVLTIKEVEILVQEWQNRSDVQQSFKEKRERINKMREEYDRIQQCMKEEMKRATPFERFRKFFRRGKSKQPDNGEQSNVSSDICSAKVRATSTNSLHSSLSGSSPTNSVSSGSYVGADWALKKPNEKIEKPTTIDYAVLPHPPKYLDLSSSRDFSDYVQPDCMICNNHNRLSSCNSSVLNDTIPECIELDQSEKLLARVNKTTEEAKEHKLYSSQAKGKKKSNDKYKTNSLKMESKRKRKNMKSKVKSAENLVSTESKEYRSVKYHDHVPLMKPNCKPISELMTCEILCAQAIKCLNDVMQTEPSNEIASGISFKFDKTEETVASTINISNTPVSECDSINNSGKGSSLNLSSLSLNSNCTVDENGEIEDEKPSLELKITEDGEIETETVPPTVMDQQNYIINMCKLPEYVNVKVQNSSELSRSQCNYTTVIS